MGNAPRQLSFLAMQAEDERPALESLKFYAGPDPDDVHILEPEDLEDPEIDWGPNPVGEDGRDG